MARCLQDRLTVALVATMDTRRYSYDDEEVIVLQNSSGRGKDYGLPSVQERLVGPCYFLDWVLIYHSSRHVSTGGTHDQRSMVSALNHTSTLDSTSIADNKEANFPNILQHEFGDAERTIALVII